MREMPVERRGRPRGPPHCLTAVLWLLVLTIPTASTVIADERSVPEDSSEAAPEMKPAVVPEPLNVTVDLRILSRSDGYLRVGIVVTSNTSGSSELSGYRPMTTNPWNDVPIMTVEGPMGDNRSLLDVDGCWSPMTEEGIPIATPQDFMVLGTGIVAINRSGRYEVTVSVEPPNSYLIRASGFSTVMTVCNTLTVAVLGGAVVIGGTAGTQLVCSYAFLVDERLDTHAGELAGSCASIEMADIRVENDSSPAAPDGPNESAPASSAPPQAAGPAESAIAGSPEPTLASTPIAAVVLAAIVVFAGVALRFGALSGIRLGYRLTPDRLTRQHTRAAIRAYVDSHPGSHFNALVQTLHLNRGALAYHLHLMESGGMILSVPDGKFRRYYTSAPGHPNRQTLNATAGRILVAIRKCPGVSQREVADGLDLSHQVVNYHVRRLYRLGIIKRTWDGGRTRLSEVPNTIAEDGHGRFYTLRPSLVRAPRRSS